MHTLVRFCDLYTSFIGLVIAFCSLVTSIVAIAVSIRTAKLPYKKKVKVTCNKTYRIMAPGVKSLYGYHVRVTNIGRPLTIEMVGLLFSNSNKVYLTSGSVSTCEGESLCVLNRGEAVNREFEGKDLVNQIKKFNFSDDIEVYGFAEDSEGKRFKAILGTVKELKKLSFNEIPLETIIGK